LAPPPPPGAEVPDGSVTVVVAPGVDERVGRDLIVVAVVVDVGGNVNVTLGSGPNVTVAPLSFGTPAHAASTVDVASRRAIRMRAPRSGRRTACTGPRPNGTGCRCVREVSSIERDGEEETT
jgi:hypothetical protein